VVLVASLSQFASRGDGGLYITMWLTTSLQSLWPVLPPMNWVRKFIVETPDLTPTLSSKEREYRLPPSLEIRATGFAGWVCKHPETVIGKSSPGGEDTGEGGRPNEIHSGNQFVRRAEDCPP